MIRYTKTIGLLCAAGLLCSCASGEGSSDVDLTKYVNTFVGTDFTGNTYPGAQVPFGMVQLSPDNGLPGWDRIAGYFYPDSTIAGFSHTHLSGTGAGDLYDISFMPVTLPAVEADAPLGIHSRFDHASEISEPGYYKVTLADYGIDVELTATERAGIQRYTFPKGDSRVILNLAKATNWDATQDTHIELVDSVTIAGYRFSTGWARDQKVYFYTRLSRPFESVSMDTVVTASGGIGLVLNLDYSTQKGDEITVSTAISSTGIEGAKRNLMAEVPDDDFKHYRSEALERWQAALSSILVSSDNREQLRVFYTALYHSMLAPTIFSDVDGAYTGPDRKIHYADGWTDYSTFSTWDTYRAAHPLFTIINPKAASDMARSLLAFCDEGGRLPVWNMWASETDMMIGYHSAAIVADAYLKGLLGDMDKNKILEACVRTANDDDYRGIGQYRRSGYVPADMSDPHNEAGWSMSKTLEYAFDDYAVAMLAKSVGNGDVYDEFIKRSRNYRNTFNPATGFMQPRNTDGSFVEPFNPEAYTEDICESNAWQYLWSVQHEPDSLVALLGGAGKFEERLDSMFTMKADTTMLPIFSTGMIGQYAHGNEPSHHVAYLYNYAGCPSKTAEYVSRIMRTLYSDTPAGLPGNEDCGQMSAWYVFSAIGMYPVNPVGGEYQIGTPAFQVVEIPVPGRKKFTLKAHNLSPENIYVKSVTVDGKPYDRSYITHDMIMSGATVELEMTGTPAPAWYTQH